MDRSRRESNRRETSDGFLKAARSHLLFPVLALASAFFGITDSLAEVAPDAASTSSHKAVCAVCKVDQTDTDPQTVAATLLHEGDTFEMCSEACVDRFVADPNHYVRSLLPRKAPPLGIYTLEGQVMALEDLPPGPKLVDFWATWCLPCLADLPNLTKLHHKYRSQGFQVVSIAIDEGPDAASKVQQAASRLNLEHPIFLDRSEPPAWVNFKVEGLPAQFLLDADGNIVRQWLGMIEPSQIDTAVAVLLSNAEPENSAEADATPTEPSLSGS